jgi:hypothetical protein
MKLYMQTAYPSSTTADFFKDWVSYVSPNRPGSLQVTQVDLQLRDPPASASGVLDCSWASPCPAPPAASHTVLMRGLAGKKGRAGGGLGQRKGRARVRCHNPQGSSSALKSCGETDARKLGPLYPPGPRVGVTPLQRYSRAQKHWGHARPPWRAFETLTVSLGGLVSAEAAGCLRPAPR